MVKIWKFKDFQQIIVPIIQKIIENQDSKSHPFIQWWLNATKGPTRVTVTSTFRSAKAFSLKDLHDYRRFLLTAPNIGQHIKLEEGNTDDGFYCRLQNDDTLTQGTVPQEDSVQAAPENVHLSNNYSQPVTETENEDINLAQNKQREQKIWM